MERFFNWIKTHKKIILLTCVAAFIIPIGVIQLIFWLGNIWPLIQTNFTENDILSYWGAFLVAIGTISLGLLALWQNHTLSLQASAAHKRLEEIEINKVKPVLNISKGIGRSGKFPSPTLNLYNRGNGIALNLFINDLSNNNHPEYNHIYFEEKEVEELAVGNAVNLIFAHEGKRDESKWHIGIAITYFDINDNLYLMEFEAFLSKDSISRLVIDDRIMRERQIGREDTQ